MLRKLLFLTLSALACLTGGAAEIVVPRLSPQPLVPSDAKLSLNGEWQFTTALGEKHLPNGSIDWKTIQVPGEWVMQGFEVEPGAQTGYARDFKLPADWQGRRIKLRCNAVYSDCSVFVNAHRVGSHLGGFTPFEFDITDWVKFGEENRIVVAVTSESVADATSSASRYAVHPLGGITRDIYLMALPEVNLAQFHVSTTFDSTYTNAVLHAEVSVANEAKAAADGLKLAFTLLAVAEMFGVTSGMGYFIQYYSDFGRFDLVAVGFIFMAIVLLAILYVFDRIRGRIIHWTLNN